MTTDNNQAESSVLKGFIAGLAGGLVASWTMNQFQTALSTFMEDSGDQNSQSQQAGGQSQRQDESGQDQRSEQGQAENEDATVKAAESIAEGLFDHQLSQSEKKAAGPAVHFATGGLTGAFYGIAAEMNPTVTTALGLPFGTAVWLMLDEGAVPALGLSKAPTQYPASTHLSALASHLVYGLTTEIVRRLTRKVLG